MLAPCWFTLWTSSRFLYPYILLISLEIFLFSLLSMSSPCCLRGFANALRFPVAYFNHVMLNTRRINPLVTDFFSE